VKSAASNRWISTKTSLRRVLCASVLMRLNPQFDCESPAPLHARPVVAVAESEDTATLRKILQYAARAAEVATPPPEPVQLQVIHRAGASALDEGIIASIKFSSSHFIGIGARVATFIGSGSFAAVFSLVGDDGALGKVIKVAKRPCSYIELQKGMAGREAVVLEMGRVLVAGYKEMPQAFEAKGRVPFVHFCMDTTKDASLLAIPEKESDMFRAILITAAADKNAKSHVIFLGSLFKDKDGII